MTRKHTIGRVLLEFSDKRLPLDGAKYSGQSQTMPCDMAAQMAEYHPRFAEYYAQAMMPLYKGYRSPYNRGTECPVKAVASRCNLEFVRITLM
jgi:hypothetical protein